MRLSAAVVADDCFAINGFGGAPRRHYRTSWLNFAGDAFDHIACNRSRGANRFAARPQVRACSN